MSETSSTHNTADAIRQIRYGFSHQLASGTATYSSADKGMFSTSPASPDIIGILEPLGRIVLQLVPLQGPLASEAIRNMLHANHKLPSRCPTFATSYQHYAYQTISNSIIRRLLPPEPHTPACGHAKEHIVNTQVLTKRTGGSNQPWPADQYLIRLIHLCMDINVSVFLLVVARTLNLI